MSTTTQRPVARVDRSVAHDVCAAFLSASSAPTHPTVMAAYRELERQSDEVFRVLLSGDSAVHVVFSHCPAPYESDDEMIAAVRAGRLLEVTTAAADRDRAQKRGGGNVLSLEISSGEERYQRDPAHNETPERIFERRWALSVLDRVMDRLRDEFVQHGRLDHFNRLKVFLLDQGETPHAALARELDRSEGALKVAIHRLRKRYRELFRQEIADTVADPAEVESELRFLAAVLTRR